MAVWMLLLFAISAAGTWLARHYALHRQLFDHPDERRSHTSPTPRGGGIGIVIALGVATPVLAWRFPSQAPMLISYLAALGLVAGVGWIDDHRALSVRTRLLVHAIAGLALGLGAWWTHGSMTMALMAFIAVPVLANVWNFMDGIDGIAALQALVVAAVLALANTGAWQALALALVAAGAGFLPFNLPRARIFLGDVGSGALGVTVAALMVAAGRADATSWMLLALPLSAFLVDASLTLVRRMWRRERWWTGHVQHAYQRAAARRGAHPGVAVSYALWAMLAAGLMLLIRPTSPFFIVCAVAAWYTVGAFCWWWIQRWAAPAATQAPHKP